MLMKKLGLLPLLLLPALAHAQSALDVNINFGTAWDSSSGAGIDNVFSNNALEVVSSTPATRFARRPPV